VDYAKSSRDLVELAQKKASHELLGLNSIIGSNVNLNTTLTCTIDYKGFTIVCFPQSGKLVDEALIQDLTKESPKISERINVQLAEAGRLLNLKPHAVMLKDDKRLTVQTSVHIQAFQIDKYDYIGRLEELFPLDYCHVETSGSPSKGKSSREKISELRFTASPDQARRLRPEFLRSYPNQICADAMTEWSACSKRECEHNDKELLRASRFLQESWVPAFVRKLDELEIRPVDSRNFAMEMHRAGVNMRYLGMFSQSYCQVSSPRFQRSHSLRKCASLT
jgi:hypothetical protein